MSGLTLSKCCSRPAQCTKCGISPTPSRWSGRTGTCKQVKTGCEKWTEMLSRRRMAQQVKMKTLPFALSVLLTALFVPIMPLKTLGADSAPNQLTEEEKKGGWKLLFDGKSTAGWRAVKKQ